LRTSNKPIRGEGLRIATNRCRDYCIGGFCVDPKSLFHIPTRCA
jgi:hypothetical protein